MKPFLGVLGDPAKIEKYSEEFYQILTSDYSSNVFHLIGASEYDVTNQDYQEMYHHFEIALQNQSFDNFDLFGKFENSGKFNSRIGLFPSHQNQLINGPSFVFAPYPSNSNSKYLKLKAKTTISLFQRFSNYNIVKLAYFPLGGKAAERTNSRSTIDFNELADRFHHALRRRWFDWAYLEAGSGESHISHHKLQAVLSYNQSQKIDSIKSLTRDKDIQRLILPKTIYGGGITSPSILRDILDPKKSEQIIIPECVVIGNISEENISETYKIIEVFDDLNQLSTEKIE